MASVIQAIICASARVAGAVLLTRTPTSLQTSQLLSGITSPPGSGESRRLFFGTDIMPKNSVRNPGYSVHPQKVCLFSF